MNSKKKFKFIKIFTYCLGFPLLSLLLLISMMPMFDEPVMGNYARNWILICLGLWAFVEIVRLCLKPISKKGSMQRDITTLVITILSVMVIMLPIVIFDKVTEPQYKEVQKEALESNVELKDYDYIMGWYTDFTKKDKDLTNELIKSTDDFYRMYGIKNWETSWYDNADHDAGLGLKPGVEEKLNDLITKKEQAEIDLVKAKGDLKVIEDAIKEKLDIYSKAQKAYINAKNDENFSGNLDELKTNMDTAKSEYDKCVASNQKALANLKGAPVELTKEQITKVVNIIQDLSANSLPYGLPINVVGMDIDVGKILKFVLPYLNTKIKDETILNKVVGMIPSQIYTGLGGAIKTNENLIEGKTGKDLSLIQAKEYKYQIEQYPSLLAFARVKHLGYIFVGIVAFSILISDHYSRKEALVKEEK